MSGKNEFDYVVILKRLCEIDPDIKPPHTMSDFEVAEQNALEFIFDKATHLGCYIHYCRVQENLNI